MSFILKSLRGVKHILETSDTRPAVLACILSAYIWGLILLLPQSVLQRPFYVGLQAISNNEFFWSCIFLCLGTVQLIRLIPKKSLPRYIWIEYFIRLLSCCLWTYIAFTALLQLPTPPVVGDTICIMLAAWWDFFRYDGHTSEIEYNKWFQLEE